MTRKIVTIVGARTQFIKAASREILKHSGQLGEVMVHIDQHYDPNMFQVFFNELEIPVPKYNLEVCSGGHGAMTGPMLEGIEQILLSEKPDWVLVYGYTSSTLAGALAAAKLNMTVAHVEAGLRSFNMLMPEEVNRTLADRVSTLLLCPTEVAVENLARKGVVEGGHNVGDVMYDVALYYGERAKAQSKVLKTPCLQEKRVVLATCQCAENTDDPVRLEDIVSALAKIAVEIPVILSLSPLHSQASAAVWAGASSGWADHRRPSAVLGHGRPGTGRKSDPHILAAFRKRRSSIRFPASPCVMKPSGWKPSSWAGIGC